MLSTWYLSASIVYLEGCASRHACASLLFSFFSAFSFSFSSAVTSTSCITDIQGKVGEYNVKSGKSLHFQNVASVFMRIWQCRQT